MKLSQLLERLEEDAERDAMLAQTVKNPDTGQDITVKTALGYDKNHPARKAAAKVYAQFMAKKSSSQPAQAPQMGAKPSQQATPQSTAKPAPRPQVPNRQANNFGTREFRRQQALKRMQQRQNPNFGSDDRYDAMRDFGAERGTWRRGRHNDPFYDPQDYR